MKLVINYSYYWNWRSLFSSLISVSFHSKCFSWTSLSICKYSCMKSLLKIKSWKYLKITLTTLSTILSIFVSSKIPAWSVFPVNILSNLYILWYFFFLSDILLKFIIKHLNLLYLLIFVIKFHYLTLSSSFLLEL